MEDDLNILHLVLKISIVFGSSTASVAWGTPPPQKPRLCEDILKGSFSREPDDQAIRYAAALSKRLSKDKKALFTFHYRGLPSPKPKHFKALIQSEIERLDEEINFINKNIKQMMGKLDRDTSPSEMHLLNKKGVQIAQLRNQVYDKLSQLLSANNVEHIVFTRDIETKFFVIVPGQTSKLNQEAYYLEQNHGTYLGFFEDYSTHFDQNANILFIDEDIISENKLNAKAENIKKLLRTQNVFESTITMMDRPEIINFVTDPDNIAPEALRFINLIGVSGSMDSLGYRFPFRTGHASNLPENLQKQLQPLFKYSTQHPEGALAVGVRNSKGEWIISFPVLMGTDRDFKVGFDEIREQVLKMTEEDAPNRPDLFLLHANSKVVAGPGEHEYLEAFVNLNKNFNSASIVYFNFTKTFGTTYSIQTISSEPSSEGKAQKGRITTHDADQLKQHFNVRIDRGPWSH